MTFIKKHQILLFFLGWFLLNLFQGAYTELLDDEAYYWIYSRFPDWGYYDHPPMIAVLIRAGYYFFSNELGVRLLIVVFNTLTMFIIYKLIPREDLRLFYALAASIAVLQIGGCIAVPDLPLCFFVALFFLSYREFLKAPSLLHSVFLGVVMALMLYSKYHGILIIFFTLFSNWKLIRSYHAYIAAGVGVILFIPHLYWQYTHDFPSLQYHLLERNSPSYKFAHTLDFLIGQVLLAGPIVGWLILWSAFKYKSTDLFERALKFSLVGFYIFFLLSSLKGRVEANWTIPAFVPLFILAHQYLRDKERWKRILVKLVPVTVVLVFAARIFLVFDTSKIEGFAKDELHQNKLWADRVKKITGDLPVVFIMTYQHPSKFWFYTGTPSFSLNTPPYRRNNFNFWPLEDSLFNRKVAVISWDYDYPRKKILTPKGVFESFVVDSFFSFSKVQIKVPKKYSVTNNFVSEMPLKFVLEPSHRAAFQSERFKNLKLEFHVFRENVYKKTFDTGILLSSIQRNGQEIVANFPIHLAPGNYQGKFAIPSCLEKDPSLNSITISLEVK